MSTMADKMSTNVSKSMSNLPYNTFNFIDKSLDKINTGTELAGIATEHAIRKGLGEEKTRQISQRLAPIAAKTSRIMGNVTDYVGVIPNALGLSAVLTAPILPVSVPLAAAAGVTGLTAYATDSISKKLGNLSDKLQNPNIEGIRDNNNEKSFFNRLKAEREQRIEERKLYKGGSKKSRCNNQRRTRKTKTHKSRRNQRKTRRH